MARKWKTDPGEYVIPYMWWRILRALGNKELCWDFVEKSWWQSPYHLKISISINSSSVSWNQWPEMNGEVVSLSAWHLAWGNASTLPATNLVRRLHRKSPRTMDHSASPGRGPGRTEAPLRPPAAALLLADPSPATGMPALPGKSKMPSFKGTPTQAVLLSKPLKTCIPPRLAL